MDVISINIVMKANLREANKLSIAGDSINLHRESPDLIDSEVKKALEEEVQKAAAELKEEQRKAIRIILEEHKMTIRQLVQEERQEIYKNADGLKQLILEKAEAFRQSINKVGL
jgi:uncharacterized membrane protein